MSLEGGKISSMPHPCSLVQRYALNPGGRDLIVGDVHGHFSRLRATLDRLGFDSAAGDRLFCVGDLVDRGPESEQALAWLELPWFHPVQGNHERMALHYAAGQEDEDEYATDGGGWNIRNTPARREEIARRLARMPIAIELETALGTVGIVHADCPTPAWSDFTAALESDATSDDAREVLIETAQWSRERCLGMCDDEVEGVRAVVVGHTTMTRWLRLGNVIHIDTGAWIGDTARDFLILDAATLQPVRWLDA